jgi:hypothetical protein
MLSLSYAALTIALEGPPPCWTDNGKLTSEACPQAASPSLPSMLGVPFWATTVLVLGVPEPNFSVRMGAPFLSWPELSLIPSENFCSDGVGSGVGAGVGAGVGVGVGEVQAATRTATMTTRDITRNNFFNNITSLFISNIVSYYSISLYSFILNLPISSL